VPDWFVYVLRCGDGSLYTGITTDVARRLAEHASGGPKAAKYLRGRGPLSLAFSVRVDGKSAALAMERWVKGLAKPRKELFAAGKLTWPGRG
jgi:putative endonuclease